MAVRLTSVAIELCLSNSYFDVVMADLPLGFWLLNERLTATGARTHGSNAATGTYHSSVTLGNYGVLPHGGTAAGFNGSAGYITMGDVAAFEFTGAFTVQFLFKTNGAAAATTGLVCKNDGNGKGWGVWMTATGAIRFLAFTAAAASVFDLTSPADYDDGLWHHCLCTWTGTTAAFGVSMYIDGVNINNMTANAGTPDTNACHLMVAAIDTTPPNGPANFFNGFICGVSLFSGHFGSGKVTTHYNSTAWTDVSADSRAGQGLHLEYGINGTKPHDRVANIGTCEFALNNSRSNSAGLRGYYSPLHANVRAGFTHNIPVRIRMIFGGSTYTRFWGRLIVIDPEPGQFLTQRTHCLAHDYAYTLTDADLREIAPQVNQADTTLIGRFFEALGPLEQPMAIATQASTDTFAYAFDDLKGGVKAITALQKLIVSGWSRAVVYGDGTVVWTNRNAQTNQVIFGIFNNDMEAIEVPSDQSDVFDVVRTITHPKAVDAVATAQALYKHPTDSADKPFVPANGGTLTIDGIYRNPNNDLQTVGGTEMVTPVSATDFVANSAEDGSGTNITANVTDVATYYASFGRFLLTNNHATLGAYFTTLQARGKGIYDKAPVTLEAGTGTRPITIDLPYQHDPTVGQEIADYVLNERQSITDPIVSFTLNPQKNSAAMLYALQSEPGVLNILTETQTGVTEGQAILRKVELDIGPQKYLRGTFGLTPVFVGFEWQLDSTSFSILGDTTIWAAG